jgi:hypothetical protein
VSLHYVDRLGSSRIRPGIWKSVRRKHELPVQTVLNAWLRGPLSYERKLLA